MTVSKYLPSNVSQEMRMLQDDELDAVIGGSVSPGYGSLGTRINISPWSINAFLDPTWELVGVTGQLPR